MRKKMVWFLIIVVFFIVGKGLISLFWSSTLNHINSFQIFYGSPTIEKINSLSKSDLVIIEPMAFSNQELALVQESKTTIIGYVSLMELENWNTELKKQVIDSDYVIQKGKQIYIEEWDTYIMDIREPHYRDILLWKINHKIVERKMDGVFFDTVDDLEYYFRDDPKIVKEMQIAFVTLLHDLERLHPELLIIQNRGFKTYQEETHRLVDGVLWEDFEANNQKEEQWTNKWTAFFKREQFWGRVKVFTVVSDKPSKQLSLNNKFTPFVRLNNTYQ